MAELTVEEKASLCLGSDPWHTAPLPRAGIRALALADGPHGLRRQSQGDEAAISGSLPATCFPTACALGSSFDPELVRRWERRSGPRRGRRVSMSCSAYGEGVFVGYRGYDALDRAVSYPFGHGLSYTRFDYSDLETAVTGPSDEGDVAVEVRCRITNAGTRRGKEVVQVYVGAPGATVARPPRELKSFAKVDLEPSQARTVTFRLGGRDLSYWSPSAADWVLEPGEFTVAVGASSRDLRLTTTVEVAGPPLPIRLDETATLQEWLADPAGAALLREVVGTDASGRPAGVLGNEQLLSVLGTFPISRLVAFPGLGVDRTAVDELLRRLPARARS